MPPRTPRSRLRKKLEQDIEYFLKRHAMAPSRFGRDCLANPNFVFDLRRGREVRLESADTIYDWMTHYEVAIKTQAA
jgi:hypothetical protein